MLGSLSSTNSAFPPNINSTKYHFTNYIPIKHYIKPNFPLPINLRRSSPVISVDLGPPLLRLRRPPPPDSEDVTVGIPEFLKGVGNGVETHTEKLETEIGDFQNFLVISTLKLKKLNIPCKHRKLILKYTHKYRLGLWKPRA